MGRWEPPLIEKVPWWYHGGAIWEWQRGWLYWKHRPAEGSLCGRGGTWQGWSVPEMMGWKWRDCTHLIAWGWGGIITVTCRVGCKQLSNPRPCCSISCSCFDFIVFHWNWVTLWCLNTMKPPQTLRSQISMMKLSTFTECAFVSIVSVLLHLRECYVYTLSGCSLQDVSEL